MRYEEIKSQIEICKLRILDHNTGGFFLHFEQFHQHLEVLADRIEQQSKEKQEEKENKTKESAMSVFLESGM